MTLTIHSCICLQGYKEEIENPENEKLVPPGLVDKVNVLFGNLDDLFKFHSDTFLKDIENCISTTELVALCFVQKVLIFSIKKFQFQPKLT